MDDGQVSAVLTGLWRTGSWSPNAIAHRKGRNPRERAQLTQRLLHQWMGK